MSKAKNLNIGDTVPIVIGMSFTEKVKLEIDTLCNSVSLYLRVENAFEAASFRFLVSCGQ